MAAAVLPAVWNEKNESISTVPATFVRCAISHIGGECQCVMLRDIASACRDPLVKIDQRPAAAALDNILSLDILSLK
ncbi:MAG TPA: hypothetical protein VGU72_21850 [Beijerinckiaceae bacterium]|jgi:hypothetical protein|nr:hypothetical protein [Beijerinckiaceae bacterium]